MKTLLMTLSAALCAGMLSSPAFSQAAFQEDYKAAKAFQDALTHNDREKVGALIHFPLRRDRPLPAIADRKEFLAHWDEFFDAGLVKRLTRNPPAEVGWRGIMLEDGCVWFSNGKASVFNCRTPSYERAWREARQSEERGLYETARGYDRIEHECSTNTVHVRAQDHGRDLRYFAWKKGASMATKPQLELRGGITEFQGSGGNYTLTFSNPPYRYILEVANICGEDCNDYLVVQKAGHEISRHVCREPVSAPR
jgi:hypothetical protein